MSTGLFYEEEEVIKNKKQIELTVPERFGMFTAKGNAKIRNYAETLVKNVKEVKGDKTKLLKEFKKYFKKYKKLAKDYSNNEFAEAGDTDVREQVWWFAKKLGKCFNLSYDEVDSMWNEADREILETIKKKKIA